MFHDHVSPKIAVDFEAEVCGGITSTTKKFKKASSAALRIFTNCGLMLVILCVCPDAGSVTVTNTDLHIQPHFSQADSPQLQIVKR